MRRSAAGSGSFSIALVLLGVQNGFVACMRIRAGHLSIHESSESQNLILTYDHQYNLRPK